jgi:hypothetical protein
VGQEIRKNGEHQKSSDCLCHVKVGPTSSMRSAMERTIGEHQPLAALKVGPSLGYGVLVHSPAATSAKIKIAVSEPERLWLDKQARAAGLTVANFFREKAGLHARPMGRPTTSQLEDLEDDAWSRLTDVGADPRQYFPPEPEQVPSEDQESPEERDARISRVRAALAKAGAYAR